MVFSIGFISPYTELADIINNISSLLDEPVDVKIGDMKDAIPIANKMVSDGVEVIISRGGTALLLREFINVPIVEIPITTIDIMKSIKKAKEKGSTIGFLGYDNVVYNIEGIEEILDVRLMPIIFNKSETVEQKTDKISTLTGKIDVVVGDNISIHIARQCGMKGILIESGADSILQGFMHAKSIRDATNKERERFEELKTILDFANDGIISINQQGKIKFFNPAAEKIIDAKKNLDIGRDISDVFPGIDFKDIITNGKVTIEKFYNIGNKTIIMNTVPIKLRDITVGALSVFQDISKIQNVEEKIRKKVYLKGHIARYNFDDMIVGNQKMHKLVEVAKLYANTDSNVLLIGETGTGKEIFTQGIHNASPRRSKPFVAFNCAALPENLLESELFGYEEGAFTGAKKGGKQGLFELAHGGTIFLDEVGEIPLHIQTRLLRVLQEKQVMRLGSDKVIPVDVRVIAATNRNLKQSIGQNTFREDLYYRLNVLSINIPPLRERKDAIPLFIETFIEKYCRRNNIENKFISSEAMQALQDYDWYGNVRELENIIERLVIVVPTKTIELYHIRSFLDGSDTLGKAEVTALLQNDGNSNMHNAECLELAININQDLKSIESEIIKKVLEINHGDRTRTANMLGIGRTTLWRWIRGNDVVP
ncbi:MAG: sigma 54-interacting transcriptional regulator [Clostridia bacterium]